MTPFRSFATEFCRSSARGSISWRSSTPASLSQFAMRRSARRRIIKATFWGIECVFSNAATHDTDLVVLSVTLKHLRTTPLIRFCRRRRGDGCIVASVFRSRQSSRSRSLKACDRAARSYLTIQKAIRRGGRVFRFERHHLSVAVQLVEAIPAHSRSVEFAPQCRYRPILAQEEAAMSDVVARAGSIAGDVLLAGAGGIASYASGLSPARSQPLPRRRASWSVFPRAAQATSRRGCWPSTRRAMRRR